MAFRNEVMAVCRRDPIFFINCFIWQYNPDLVEDEVGPFITWPFQEEALVGADREVDGEWTHFWGILESVVDRKDVRWQKSREMGATYLVLIAILWVCIFYHNKSTLVVSRDKDAVNEPGNLAGSLFPKIVFMLSFLPNWMVGEVLQRGNGIEFKKTGSMIFGEASTGKAGVSSRFTLALIDEFGQIREDREIYGFTADTCHARVFVFTHSSTATMAYELCFDPQFRSMREIITHWSQHPRKNPGLYKYNPVDNSVEVLDRTYSYPPDFEFVMNGQPSGGPFPGVRSPWYDEECARRHSRFVAMDLDIDPKGASTEFFPAFLVAQLKRQYCEQPRWRGNVTYDKLGHVPAELVPDRQGMLKLWIYPQDKHLVKQMRAGAGADISSGVGKSPSCLSVFDFGTGEKVAEYANRNVDPKEAAHLFMAILSMFKDEYGQLPKFAWETNGPGLAFGNALIEDLRYPNPWSLDDVPGVKKRRGVQRRLGWASNDQSKRNLLEDYVDGLKNKRYINRSEEAMDETAYFVYSEKGVEYKRKGKGDNTLDSAAHHGDLVIADALACMTIRRGIMSTLQEPFPELDERSMAWRLEYARRSQAEEFEWL